MVGMIAKLEGSRCSSKGKKVDQALWDKLKPWRALREDVERLLMDPGGIDPSITLEHGLQLMETLRHSSRIRAMTHFTSSTAEVFLTHYKIGSVNINCAWDVQMRVSGEVKFNLKKFETDRIISQLIFIPTHYVYVAFCSDLHLLVFKDYKNNCEERSTTTCITTLLCMAYIKETDELITGGIGELLRWTLHGIERGHPPQPGRKFDTSITREDWVRDVKIDQKFKRILALCGFRICVVNYETDKQTHFIESRHIGALCCCSFYKLREYFITAGMDGCIKVWNAGAMKQVHEFVGHYGRVTSLQISKTDPLLLSSSLDGTVHVWRMDNFQWLKRLDVGERIYSMKLLGRGNLYCQTINNVLIYSLNQFYNTFSTVESTVSCLQRMSWPGYISSIIASTEDGSVRFLSPVTGSTITIIFPLPTFQVFHHFSYNRKKNILFTLIPNGEVLIFDCSSNPCIAVELREPNHADDRILSLTLVSILGRRGIVDDMLTFVGHANGEVSLLDADHHTLAAAVKLHGAGVVCLETVEGFSRGRGGCVGRLVSAGANITVKVTDVFKSGNEVSLRARVTVQFGATPIHVSMFENMVCAVLSPYRVAMIEVDFSAKKHLDWKVHGLSHSHMDDHTAPVTGLDGCQALGLFVTAALDGYVKIWDTENNLVRELCFGDTLQGVCFANTRGDILAGFERHVVSVSISRYLPSYLLETLVSKRFKDEEREDPLSFNNKLRLSFDPKKLPTFSTNPERRRSQLKLYKLSSSEDRIAIAEGNWKILDDVAKYCLTSHYKFIEEQKKAMDLLGLLFNVNIGQPLLPKSAFKRLADKAMDKGLFVDKGAVAAATPKPWEISLAENVKQTERKLDGVLAVMRAESKPHSCKLVTAEDMPDEIPAPPPPDPRIVQQRKEWRFLHELGRKWMIPVFGHVPNSVVRKRFDQKFGLSEEDKHGTSVRMRSMKYRYRTRRRLTPIQRRMKKLAPAIHKMSKELEQITERTTLTGTTGPGSAAAEAKAAQRGEAKFKMPDYQIKTQFGPKFRTRKSLPTDERKRGKRMGESDDERATFIEDIHVEGAGIFLRVLKEDWFPKNVNIDKFNIIATLLSIIETDDPIINKSVCNYLLEIRECEGLPNQIELDLVKALLVQLNSKKHSIQKESIWTLGELGFDSKDIIMGLMPKLVDNSPVLRNEATLAIQKILGVSNKEDLLAALEQRGFIHCFMENFADEEEIFQRLSRQAEGVLYPIVETRLMGWLDTSTDTFTEPGWRTAGATPRATGSAAGKGKRDRGERRGTRQSVFQDRPSSKHKGRKGSQTPARRRGTSGQGASGRGSIDSSVKRKASSSGGGKKKAARREGSVSRPGRRRTSGSQAEDEESSSGTPSSEGSMADLLETEEEEEEMYDRGVILPPLPEVPALSPKQRLARALGISPNKKPAVLANTVMDAMKKAGMDAAAAAAAADRFLTAISTGEETDVSKALEFVMADENLEAPVMADAVFDLMSMAGLGRETVTEASVGAMTSAEMQARRASLKVTRRRALPGQQFDTGFPPPQLDGQISSPGDDDWDLGEFSPGADFAMPKYARMGPLGMTKDKAKKVGDKTGAGVGRAQDDAGQLSGMSDWSDEQLTSGVPSTPVDQPDRKLYPRHSFIYRYYEKFAKRAAAKATVAAQESPGLAPQPAMPESTPESEGERKRKGTAESDTAGLVTEDQDQYSDYFSQQLTSSVHEVSTVDSGISQDVSEASSYRVRPVGTLVDRGLPCLSPVKSVLEIAEAAVEEKVRARSSPHLPEPPEGWRDFFNRPSAQERRRLQLVRRDFAEGKTTPLALILPPISYVRDNVTLRPGNSGFRLLQRVTVNDKDIRPGPERHTIEPLPAKLGIHTKTESHGSSQFGILQLQWTTDVPVAVQRHRPEFVPGRRGAPPEASHVFSELPPLADRLMGRVEGRGLFAQSSEVREPSEIRVYKWETPLPPAPAHRGAHSRPLSPRRGHSLAKQRMHQYTSAELLPLHLESHEAALKRTLRFYCKPGR